MSQGASRAGMMARLMAAAATLGAGAGNLHKLPFAPGPDLIGDSKANERRKRASGTHSLHKQAIGSWRRSKSSARWTRPHQSERECARRLRQMARNASYVAAEGRA